MRGAKILFFSVLVSGLLSRPASAISEKDEEVKGLQTELMVAKTEAEAMKQLNKLLSKYKGTAMEPGLLLRKAELYVRQSKTERFYEVHRNSETLVSLVPTQVKKASSKIPLQKAVDTYEQIQRTFPRFRDMDIVLFNNAFTRQQLNQNEVAKSLYRKLEKEYPESSLMPDTHLALGEMLFDGKKFHDSLLEFQKIRKYPNARVYPYGIYKAGWAKYNLRDTEGALKELEDVVEFGKRVEKENLDAKLDLRSEALQDMVLFFADARPAAQALKYFTQQAGEKESGKYLLKLASLYTRHSKPAEHERVLRDFIADRPQSLEVPLAYKALIEEFEIQRKRDEAVLTLSQFDEACAPKSAWSKANGANTIAKEGEFKGKWNTCEITLRQISLVHANKWHRMWKKNPTFTDFAKASEKAYKIYLKFDDKTPSAWEARYALAELQFQQEKYRESSDNYFIVAQQAVDPKLYHEAGYSAVVALEKATQDKWSDQDEKRFQQLADNYTSRNKNGKYLSDVQFKAAFIAYEKNRYEESAPVFRRLATQQPPSQWAEKSQSLYLDILNIKKNYSELKLFAGQLLKLNLSDSRKKQIQKVHEESWFAEAQDHQDKSNFKLAAEQFEDFAKKQPQSHLADKAWWNAIEINFKIGHFSKAAQMSAALPQLFPESDKKKVALLKAAQSYEAMANLAKAADILNELSKIDRENDIKWLTLSADFYALSSQKAKALVIYKELSKNKTSAVSSGAYEKIMALSENEMGYEKLLAEIANRNIQPQASLAHAEIAERQLLQKQESMAFKTASEVVGQRKEGASPVALAKARFVQAQILEKEFYQQNVKSRGDRLALVLQIKTEKLEKAQSAYQDVIRYGESKTTVKSLQRLALLYGHYVDSLRNLELVGEVSKEDLKALREELENMALPVEDKRVDTLNEALKLAKKFELRDGSIGEIQTEINRINMKRSPSQTLQIQLPQPWVPKMSGGII